jgi:hypothetical protein
MIVQTTITASAKATNGDVRPIATASHEGKQGRLAPTPIKKAPTARTCHANRSCSFDLGFLVSK